MKKIALLMLAVLSSNIYAKHNSHQSWDQLQGNSAHTGYSNTTVDPAMVKKLWVKHFPTEGRNASLLNRIVVADNALYLTNRLWGEKETDNKYLIALRPENGEVLWKVSIPVESSSPALYNNKLYLTTKVGENRLAQNIALNIYDAQNGDLIISSPATTPREDIGPPVIDNNQVFISSHFTQLAANATTGAMTWKSGEVAGSDLSATITSHYVLRPLHDALTVLDRKDGHLIKTIQGSEYPFFYDPSETVVWDESRHTAFVVYEITRPRGAVLSAIDTELGTVKWTTTVTNHYISSPVFANNMIYFVSSKGGFEQSDNYIYAVNANNGKLEWTYNIEDEYFHSNLIVTNNALIYHIPGKVVILSLQTHRPIASIETPGCGYMSLANDTLYVGDDNCMGPPFDHPGYLTAINLN
jgi:outer membrane protein assembly factor BamB